MEGRQEGQERAKCARRGPLTSPRHDLSRVGRQRGERLDQSSPPRGAVVRAAQVSRGEIAGAAHFHAASAEDVQATCRGGKTEESVANSRE